MNVSLNGQNYYPLTLSEQAENQADWYGSGDVLKYMVSIAQLGGAPTGVTHDGYAFAMAGNSPQVQINNLALGQCKNGNKPAICRRRVSGQCEPLSFHLRADAAQYVRW